jgi:hypothetical protein
MGFLLMAEIKTVCCNEQMKHFSNRLTDDDVFVCVSCGQYIRMGQFTELELEEVVLHYFPED